MTIESSPDEMVIIEEQVELERPSGLRGASGRRIAGIVLGSVALGLAATAVARRLASRRGIVRGRGSRRKRGAWLSVQPRAAVFAPSLTISLPFSSIVGQPSSGRMRAAGRRQARLRRPAAARRGRRMSGSAGRPRRFAERVAGR